MELGNLLREARQARKLTMQQVGKQVGVSSVYISDIEHGYRIPVKNDTLQAFAKIFDLDKETLVTLATKDRYAKMVDRDGLEFAVKLAEMMKKKGLRKEKFDQILKIAEVY